MKYYIFTITLGIAFLLLSFTRSASENFPHNENVHIIDIINSYKKAIVDWPKPNIDYGVQWNEFEAIKLDKDYFKNQEQPIVVLGKTLFFDPRLSKSNQISCSSCHDPEMGWTDHRRVSLGNNHLLGKRNTQSLYNIANRKAFFWDGRAISLEEQALGPISSHHEMDMDINLLPNKVKNIKGYLSLFKKAFGDDNITYTKIVKSLAEFQATIKSQPSRLDKFIEGDYNALTDQEIYGMHLFRTKARCMNCHSGKDLTDDKFHNIGLTYYKREYQDLGLYEITKNPDDVGKFRTPQLRDLELTRPWMHNGLFDDLEGIVNMYNSGMHRINPKPQQKIEDPLYPITDSLLKPLQLTKDETKAIVAFLKSISGSKFKMRRPELPQ